MSGSMAGSAGAAGDIGTATAGEAGPSGTGTRLGAQAVRDWRGHAGDCVLLDGFHALKHALRFGAEIPLVLTSDREGALALAADLAPDVADELASRAVAVSDDVLRTLVPRLHPTRIAALAVRPARAAQLAALSAPSRTAPVVVLDNPRNLGNAGAVIRLAAGFGAVGVVTTGTLDPWHPTVVRGAAGLHFATAVEHLDVAGLPAGPVFALDPEGEDIRSFALPDDALLAFGSERTGISAELRARADHLVSLPMRRQVSSYNLATSVGMTLFHWSAGHELG